MKFNKTIIRVLFLIFVASFFMGPTAWADNVQRVICPKPYEVHITKSNSGNIIECWRWVKSKKPIRDYKSYTPCKSPGRYNVRDETSSGRSRGKDRCTIGGFSGPPLPCGIGASREIVRNGKDKCYTLRKREIKHSQFLVCRHGMGDCTK